MRSIVQLNRLFALSLLLGLQTLVTSVFAQESDRPKLGLVLSGGGARGVAHIGVIKAMEEAGLRPDYIAGTSMGSIIAGLYAMGYSAEQMEEVILEVQWDQILSNKVPLNYISFEEKEYYDRYLVGIPLNNKLQPDLGSGLLHGQMLTEVLHRYFWTAMQYENFDEFPIPYRCIGTDVNNAKAIVFEDGSLPTALRSSMAIPSVFTAVDFDTTLVVDGGVVNNFPVDIVREMGADYVIGINVGATSSGEAPDDLGSIMMALASIPSKEKLQEHIEDCDIYIQPDLGDYSSSSFTKAPEILEFGLEQGQKHKTEFEKLAKEMGMSLPPFEIDSVTQAVVLHSVNYEGNSMFSDVLIDKKLGIKEGDTVSRDEMEEAIRRVYGINGFDKVEHEIHLREDGSADLRVIMKERLPFQLYASVHADNIFSEGIVLNFTARDLLGKESRSIFTADISSNPRFRFDYYKYLSVNKKFALNFRYDFSRDQLPSYMDGERFDVEVNTINRVALNVMSTQSLASSFSIGGFYENLISSSQFNNIVPESIKNGVQEVYGVRLTWFSNSLNDRNFPTRGSESEIFLDNYLKSNVFLNFNDGVDTVLGLPVPIWREIIKEATPAYYLRFLYNHISYIPLAKRFSMIPRATLGLVVSDDTTAIFIDEFRVGGWQQVWRDDIRLLGLQYGETTQSNFGIVGLKFQHLFMDNLFVKYGADLMGYYPYVALSRLDTDFSFETLFKENLIMGYGASVTLRTVLGPISGGISFNTIDPHPRYYFALGFSFNYSD